MATNILLLPVVQLVIETATNADWLDGLEYWTSDDIDREPIDLTGIDFLMHMRSAAPVATVVLRAGTDNGLIRLYANTWQFVVPATTMRLIPPGGYVFDLLGMADGYTRNLVQAEVGVDLGITRKATNPMLFTTSSNVIPFPAPPTARTIAADDGMPF